MIISKHFAGIKIDKFSDTTTQEEVLSKMLNVDVYGIVFGFLPITDKRSFLRTCIRFNKFSSQMPQIEAAFQSVADEAFFPQSHSNYHRLLCKYTIELVYDNRDLPDKYIISDNDVLRRDYKILKTIGVRGDMSLITKLLATYPDNKKFIAQGAAKAGNTELLKKLCDMGCVMGWKIVLEISKAGQLETLKWLNARGCKSVDCATERGAGCGGHMHIINFLVDCGACDTFTVSYYAALKGHIDAVKCLHKINPLTINNAIYGAVAGGHLEILIYAYEHTRLEKNRAFSSDHLHIWQWLIENDHYEYDVRTIINVVECGNLECLQYIHSKGFDVAHEEVMSCAMMYRHTAIICWLYQIGVPCDPRFDYSALFDDGPRSSALKQILSLGYDFSQLSCRKAALRGNLCALQCQYANGYILSGQTIAYAALGGHLEIIVWCRQEGCVWDADACAAAVKGNHLGILKWLRGIDRNQWTIGSTETEICPWNAQTCANAIYHFEVDILMFAVENGCEYLYNEDDNLQYRSEFRNKCQEAISKRDPITASYIRKKLNIIDN